MSAPCSNGRHRYGEDTVLSTISGMPCRCATSASAAKSVTLPAGLPTDSQNIARVPASMSLSNVAGSRWSANLTWMPYCGSVCANRL